jgi:hypothetical protein
MDYVDMDYRALKKECAARNLGGAGKKHELVDKLLADDNDEPLPEVDPPRKESVFSNWDENGKWVRRPKDFISWEEEKRKAG